MIKNILGRVLALWALLTFVLSLLFVILFALINGRYPEPLRSKKFHTLIQRWMTFFFFITGVKRKFKGKEHFNGKETFIVICNHNSLMDPPLSSPGIPEANKTIAKKEMAGIPLFGIMYKRGSVLVDRKSDESRKKSYSDMKEVLQLGLHMCIYPEGTRNKTTEPLQRFHDGAFRLAVETGKAIIPSLLFNTKEVLPPNKNFYFWPHSVAMHFLPPVPSVGKTVQELKEECFDIMKDYYEKHRH